MPGTTLSWHVSWGGFSKVREHERQREGQVRGWEREGEILRKRDSLF